MCNVSLMPFMCQLSQHVLVGMEMQCLCRVGLGEFRSAALPGQVSQSASGIDQSMALDSTELATNNMEAWPIYIRMLTHVACH